MRLFLLFITAILFAACENSIDENIIKKYETNLNKNLKKELKFIPQDNFKLDFTDFSCKANKNFVECLSQNLKFSLIDQNKSDETIELLSIKNLKFSTNEIYTGKEKGLIDLDEYYDFLFKQNKNLKSSLSFEEFSFSQNSLDLLESVLYTPNTKLLLEILKSPFKLNFENTINKNKDFSNNLKLSFLNPKFELNTDINLSAKEKILNNLMFKISKFDTENLILDDNITKILKDKESFELYKNFLNDISLNDIKLSLKLYTNGEFKDYVDNLKLELQNLKERAGDERQILLFDKLLLTINDITKTEPYNADIYIAFKDFFFANYENLSTESLQKLNINNQDFTQSAKMFLGILLMSAMFSDLSVQ